jgi:hypothetical protein
LGNNLELGYDKVGEKILIKQLEKEKNQQKNKNKV